MRRTKRLHLMAAAMVALALGPALAGCGGSGHDPTLTIGARGTAEEEILGQIYAQALRAAGYTVARNVKLDIGLGAAAASEGLERDSVTGYVEHLSTPSSESAELEEVPADPQKAYEKAKAALERKGLTAFPPTPFSFTNLVGALRTTAEKRHLRKVSDLEGHSEDLTIAGVAGCHERMNCVEGLERRYGLQFAGFIYRFSGPPTEPFRALETRFSDLAMLPSTDGRLATEKGKFATLEEDRHLFPAGNAIFVTTQKAVEEAGPGYEEAIVAAQKGLTLPVMQELDARVELEKKHPAEVAAEYLESAGRSD
jgi:glycine betaine/choline ABC-type transport system substrate-binding protein